MTQNNQVATKQIKSTSPKSIRTTEYSNKKEHTSMRKMNHHFSTPPKENRTDFGSIIDSTSQVCAIDDLILNHGIYDAASIAKALCDCGLRDDFKSAVARVKRRITFLKSLNENANDNMAKRLEKIGYDASSIAERVAFVREKLR